MWRARARTWCAGGTVAVGGAAACLAAKHGPAARTEEAGVLGGRRVTFAGRPSCWEEVQAKYVPVFQQLTRDGCTDSKDILAAFASTAKQIEAPVLEVPVAGGVVSIVGSCHHSRRSAERVKEMAKGRRAVVLELCDERAATILACPVPHRRSWLTSQSFWSEFEESEDDTWAAFSLDQYNAACCGGEDMVAAIAGDPELVVLGDASQSAVDDEDDPGREQLLAKACAAAVSLGYDDVLCVVGADHLNAVAEALAEGHAHALEDLTAALDDGAVRGIRAWFLGKRVLRRFQEQCAEVAAALSPEEISRAQLQVPRGSPRVGALRDFEIRAELQEQADGGCPTAPGARPGALLRRLREEGMACSPATFAELRAWWEREKATSDFSPTVVTPTPS